MDVVDLRDFLCPAARHGGPPLHRPRHPRALDRHGVAARSRHRLRHALSRLVPGRSRALPRADAGAARRGALAVVEAGACRARRRGRLAADRLGGGPRAAGARTGKFGRPDRTAARSVAGDGGRRPACSRWCRIGAACGRAWTRRRSVQAGPIRARRSRICCARPGSRRPAGAKRSTCRRFHSGCSLRSAAAWERAGATISAPFAGVHIVEATKQVYRAIPARRERRRLMPVLKPVLIPSPGAVGASRSFAVRNGRQ